MTARAQLDEDTLRLTRARLLLVAAACFACVVQALAST